ncbi:MAG: hypothetical protein A4S09_13925 [Proteobacteria bacterium SG_bin7]|nr:MAG: hypothetical protein A4S09_13925 [Proteobacteria bacterium SG_bin7]
MKLFLVFISFISTLISISAEAVIINLDADVRVTAGTRGCRIEDKMIRTEFSYQEDQENGFADWIGIVQIKPKIRNPSRIPSGGLDLTKAKDVVFPVEDPPNCEFKMTIGTISGTEQDEINLIFRGRGCKPVIDIFAQDNFKELGLEWAVVPVGGGQEKIDGLTMTIYNSCKDN